MKINVNKRNLTLKYILSGMPNAPIFMYYSVPFANLTIEITKKEYTFIKDKAILHYLYSLDENTYEEDSDEYNKHIGYGTLFVDTLPPKILGHRKTLIFKIKPRISLKTISFKWLYLFKDL